MTTELGLLHVYTGNGKGKTTAAVGLCVRAAGAGLKVLFVQFMKARASDELEPLEALGVKVFRAPKSPKFVRDMSAKEKIDCMAAQFTNLCYVKQYAAKYDLVVLDEVMSAVSSGMLPLEDVLEFLDTRPAAVEVALTGRDAPVSIRDRADYISEIQEEKHPYHKGISARRGIEF